MFDSQVLEVSVGLVLCFLLVSLMLSAVRESIESFTRTRAVDLERAISELVQDPTGQGLRKKLYDHPLIYALYRGEYVPADFSDRSTSRGSGKRTLPTYIPREQFTLAMLDLMRKGEVAGKAAEAIESIAKASGGDLDKLRRDIGAWYDGAMDRASGWYRRRTQHILFALGLALALVLNINAVVIGQALATNTVLRDLMVETAQPLVAGGGQGATIDARELSDEVRRLELPIGWSDATFDQMKSLFVADSPWRNVLQALTLAAGYLATGFAATLGAPFWFDVLNKFMVIRSTVKPTEKSKDEGSEDRLNPADARPARQNGDGQGGAG